MLLHDFFDLAGRVKASGAHGTSRAHPRAFCLSAAEALCKDEFLPSSLPEMCCFLSQFHTTSGSYLSGSLTFAYGRAATSVSVTGKFLARVMPIMKTCTKVFRSVVVLVLYPVFTCSSNSSVLSLLLGPRAEQCKVLDFIRS